METILMIRGYIGVVLGILGTYWNYIGVMEGSLQVLLWGGLLSDPDLSNYAFSA